MRAVRRGGRGDVRCQDAPAVPLIPRRRPGFGRPSAPPAPGLSAAPVPAARPPAAGRGSHPTNLVRARDRADGTHRTTWEAT